MSYPAGSFLEADKTIRFKLWLKTVGLVLGIFLLFGWLIKTLYIMLAPFLISLLISYLLHPSINRLQRKGMPRGWAVLLIFTILSLASGLFIFFLLPGMIRELESLYTDLPTFIFNLEQGIKAWQSRLMPNYPFLARIDVGVKLSSFRHALRLHLLQALPYLSRVLTPYILFIPLLTFFLLRDGPSMRKALFRLVPNRYFEVALNLQYRVSQQIRNYIKGILLDSVCIGAITTLGLYLINIKYALFLGIGYGLANLVPFFGPILGTIPGIVLAASQGGAIGRVISVILVYAFAQFISLALIIPLLMARMVELHPLLIMMAVIVGGDLFGPIGPLIAVPLTCILRVVLWESYYGIKSLKH